jgi:hypothetical protein
MRFVVTLTVVIMAAMASTSAGAADDDLRIIYAQVIRNPTDTQLNLRYARLAEERGMLRWALAAYERMLVNDPDNDEVKRGLQRIRRKLQPSVTQWALEVGGIFESNPRYSPTNPNNELQVLGTLGMRDERNLGDWRWRTTGSVAGWWHQKESDLNYAYAGGVTGPVLDVASAYSLHLAAGGGASYFDNRFFYGEAVAQATLEGYLDGAYRAIQVRGAWRTYDNFFPLTEGFYADATGRFHFPEVIGEGSLLVLSPWARWSGISGIGISSVLTDVQPGAYVETGMRSELMKSITPWLVLGPTFSVYHRWYSHDVVPATVDTKRRDLFIVPGATALFPNLFAYQTGLRLDYKYIDDKSNDFTRGFTDHILSATIYARF